MDKLSRSKVWPDKILVPPTKCLNSRKLLKIGRIMLSTCVQWITGFCNLMRHRHKKNPALSDSCRLCDTGPETPEHLTFLCPRLTQYRADSFRLYNGTPESWHAQDLINFIQTAPISQLLVDETDYGDQTARNAHIDYM